MPSNFETRKTFNLSIGDLSLFTNTLAFTMRRDISNFAEYGITEANITAMMAINTTLENMPNDEILKADYGEAIEIRDMIRTTIMKTMRSIAVRAKSAFSDQGARYKSLNPGIISQMTDSELIVSARQVHHAAVENLTELMKEGLTEVYLTNFENDIQMYEAAIDEASKKLFIREDATEQRIATANKLYGLVSKYCDYGKIIFENGSPARYNEYVIYPPSAGSLKAPTGLKFVYSFMSFAWEIEKNATSYQLEYSPDGINFVEVYSGMNEYCDYTPANEGWSYYRVRARNANGFGPYSEVLKQGYYATLPAPTNSKAVLVSGTVNEILLTWDEVPSATNYLVYMSEVAIGAPVGPSSFKADVRTNSFTLKAEQGKRYYFALTSGTHYQWSGFSQNCFIDVP